MYISHSSKLQRFSLEVCCSRNFTLNSSKMGWSHLNQIQTGGQEYEEEGHGRVFFLFDAAGGCVRGGGEFVLFFPKNQNMARECWGSVFINCSPTATTPLFFHCSDFSWLSFTHFHFINKLLENVMAKHVWHKGKSVWRGSIISLNVLA